MKEKRRTLALTLCLALLLPILVGMMPVSASEENILRFSHTVELQTTDPQLGNSMPTQTIMSHAFETLMRNNSGDIDYAAAESHEMSEDGLTYTFHLRDGLVWSDGKPLTADQYVYGIRRLLDPDVAASSAFFGYVLKNGEKINSGEGDLEELGVEAPDDMTVVFTLEYPAAYFLDLVSKAQFAPAREDIVAEHGTAFGSSAETNVYCGPFIISEWLPNDRIVMVKNEKYWNAENIKLSGVEILTVSDGNTALGMFEAGDLHFAHIPTAIAQNYPDADFYYSGANDYVSLNQMDQYETRSKNLRLALNYGLNRADYIALATNDIYEANLRFILPQVHGVEGEYGSEYPLTFFPLEGDLEKAQEYLTAALEDLGLTDPSEIEIELLASDSDTARTEAEVIQNQWQENLGITVTIRQVEYRQRLQMQDAKDFEAVLTGWGPDYSDPYTYLELWTTTSPYNQVSYSSEEYDRLIKEANASTDPKVRMDLLFEAEKVLLGDGVIVPQQLRRIPYLQDPRLQDFKLYFVGLQHNFIYAYFTD